MKMPHLTEQQTEQLANLFPVLMGRRAFTLDGKPVDIGRFALDNELQADDLAVIALLEPGESTDFGGGAAATFTLRRTA